MISDIAKIASSFDQYIVQPVNAFGVGGFIFDVEGESTVTLNNEITDHFTEDNSAIQDHIAVRPNRLILRSYVGEVVYRLDPDNDTTLQQVVQKLTILNGYLPELSAAVQQAKDVYENGIGNVGLGAITGANISQAADLWANIKNLTPPIPRQAQAYMYFKALRDQKILVSVQSPFEFMANMAIESVIGFQGEDSKYISDFTITLKQIRTAPTVVVPFNESRFSSRPVNQNSIDSEINTRPATISPPIGVSNKDIINLGGNIKYKDLSVQDITRILSTNYQGSSAAQIAPLKNNGKTNGVALPAPQDINQLRDLFFGSNLIR